MTADLTCRELVEVVSDYLEATLTPVERVRLEQHLLLCDGCASYVEQLRLAIRVTRTLSRPELRLEGRDELLKRLRELHRETP